MKRDQRESINFIGRFLYGGSNKRLPLTAKAPSTNLEMRKSFFGYNRTNTQEGGS
jgi:hypothetical protein